MKDKETLARKYLFSAEVVILYWCVYEVPR